MLLTFLEQINIEQEMERELEAKIQGKLYHSIFTFQTSRQNWKNTWNEFTISWSIFDACYIFTIEYMIVVLCIIMIFQTPQNQLLMGFVNLYKGRCWNLLL